MHPNPTTPCATLDRPAAPAALTQGVFHALMIAALPGLRQQALALTRNRPDADDLVQAAVSNALAAQASFTPETNFRAWMSRILRNRFFSNIRARRETVTLDDAPPARLARDGGQEEHIAMQELRRCMARLQPDHRLVLLMITVQGLSYEEASAELGVAVGTLKCRVFRARRQLKAWMLGEEPEAASTQDATRAKAAISTRDASLSRNRTSMPMISDRGMIRRPSMVLPMGEQRESA